MKKGISAIMVVHNEEKVIRRCLESIKGVVDEILIIHDGKCQDKTIEICNEYTKNVFIRPRKRMAAMQLKFLFEKVRYEWVLKIDADELLSNELRENIRELIKNPKADAYSFLWLFWDGEKEVTKKWPRKMALYRIAKSSFLGFPHWDDPKINGNILPSDYKLEHKTPGGNVPNWKTWKKKGLKKYLPAQAKNTLRNFKEFDQFQYDQDDFPLAIQIRRKVPLFSAVPFAVVAFLKKLFTGGAWREGGPAIRDAFYSMNYYFILGIQIHKLKKQKG